MALQKSKYAGIEKKGRSRDLAQKAKGACAEGIRPRGNHNNPSALEEKSPPSKNDSEKREDRNGAKTAFQDHIPTKKRRRHRPETQTSMVAWPRETQYLKTVQKQITSQTLNPGRSNALSFLLSRVAKRPEGSRASRRSRHEP